MHSPERTRRTSGTRSRARRFSLRALRPSSRGTTRSSGTAIRQAARSADDAAEGKVPRWRLLDATLDALQRDFVQYRAGWFAGLHRDLQPSVAERVERLDRYSALLASRIPPTVSFALDALVTVERAGELPPEVLLAHLAPAVQARAKK